MMSADTIWYFSGVLLFGAIIYYIIFQAPPSDMVYSSKSVQLINELETYLQANNIKAYTKNATEFRRAIRGPKESSLHVIDPTDKDRAIKLIVEKITNDAK